MAQLPLPTSARSVERSTRGALRAGRIRGGTSAGRPAYRIRVADLDRWLFADEGGDA